MIAMRLTNSSGRIIPIPLPVPDLAAGQSPGTGVVPFTNVNLHAHLKNYEQITITNLQVFPDVTTLQDLEMIPLSELPAAWDQAEDFNTPPQNL